MPAIKLYADHAGRFVRQLLTDLLVLAWVLAWVWIGHAVHDATLDLAEPGHQTVESATSMAGGLSDAGDTLGGVPVVGDGVSAPFDEASGAAQGLAEAGRAEVRAAERLAFWLGLSVAAIPVLGVAALYLTRRVRFVRRATAGQRFLDGPADLDLFALRAMANQPMHVLARISDDPVGALRDRDQEVIARLAEVELRDHGLRPPAAVDAATGRAH